MRHVGMIRRALDWLTVADAMPVTFSADTPPRPIAEVILEMNGYGLFPRAGRQEALSIAPVLRGRNMICSIATLPLVQLGDDFTPERLSLLEQIDPDVPNVVTIAQTAEDLLFEGISWWEVTAFGADGYPTSARHVDYGTVSLQPPNSGRSPAPLPGGYDPRGAVIYMDGRPVPYSRVIRFDSPNPGLLKACGRVIRQALLIDQTSALYANNPRPLDYFTPNEDADPVDDDTVKELLAEWQRARKQRSTAYVPAALTYNSVDTPTPAELQLVELEKQASLKLANALGLDPEDLGISTTSRTYQNGVDRRQDRINDTLSPYMSAITDRLSMPDVTKRGRKVVFDLDDYMRADPTTRATFYQRGIEDGWLTPDEVRAEERRPKLTAAQKASLKPEPAAPPAAPDNVRPIRVAAGFMADTPAQLTFEGRPLAESFARVDLERRLIEGIALPYNRIAVKDGRKYRFQPGSLQYVEARRNKLLRDHDMSQPQGRLNRHEDRPEGAWVQYRVAAGDDGDRTLAEAEDGRRDGLSVGVDIIETTPDPLNRGVLLVLKAEWFETSVLAIPAFDDARVTRVVAAKDQGESMDTCATCGATLTAGVTHSCTTTAVEGTQPPPPALRLGNEQLQALIAVPGVLAAMAGVPAQQNAPAQEQFGLTQDQIGALVRVPGVLAMLTGQGVQAPVDERPTVNPTRSTASTEVREPAPYRFDRKGNLTKGSHDFSTDVIAGLRDGDREALQRAERFVQAQFVQFDTDMADAASLNPAVNRPDMYVDQKDYEYPIWGAIEKGTLADSTPFVLPKFNSSSGMVAGHTEGVEPSLGTFTATSQTITPSAVSGKVSITREAWDQGGNPQLSGLVWRQMLRAWFEALEASAVTLLEGLAPTTIALDTAAQDEVLVSQLKRELAKLRFVRGGFRMRDFFNQVDLYSALVDAKDADGRSLLPVLGPSNADGQTSEFFGDISIAGLRGRPAWALAASGTVSANSYLFDRGDVSGWASAPNRLTFENVEVRYVHLGIWGYKALACTDLTGVRRIAYDPA